jgi:hypothetical protein
MVLTNAETQLHEEVQLATLINHSNLSAMQRVYNKKNYKLCIIAQLRFG